MHIASRSRTVLIALTLGAMAPAASPFQPLTAQSTAEATAPRSPRAARFTLDQVMSYPYATALTAAATGSRIAWTLNAQGVRNIFVAEGPSFEPRQLTPYSADDGQELTSVALSPDGSRVVYVRGGEHGSNWDRTVPVNPGSLPVMPGMQLWSVAFSGGAPTMLADGGDEPTISPRGDRVAFTRGGSAWIVPIDGSTPARKLFDARGTTGGLAWSPDGSRLAFVSGRTTHAFIGVYESDTTSIRWIAPSTSRDGTPRWSPDGTRLVFVRRPGAGGPPEPSLEQRHAPWAIWVADARTGEARERWTAPATPRGNIAGTHGGTNLHWTAGDRIVFMTELDGWPHMYSMAVADGDPSQLTSGRHMVEYVELAADGRHLIMMANAGADVGDIDRRHLLRVAVDRAAPEQLTSGTGLEFAPVVTGDGSTIAFFSATPQRPPVLSVMPASGGDIRLVGATRVPADFPAAQLVTPRQVTYRAPDGVLVHAQLFERPGGEARKPAIVYVHGGPSRQMLLGWHYGDYYANAYAMNQYLAELGYVVLSVNYRLGIGYGQEFQRAAAAGAQGAAEYQDVKAGGEWLKAQPQVDGARIGIYGGSYGGYLTALALGRDSDLFAAGVDIHGVHDFTAGGGRRFGMGEWRYEATDADSAAGVAWRSSPVSAVDTWRSPVLLIHGDDDRNVRVSETVDLVQRLRATGVPYEEIMIPDDTHHFMRFANQRRVNAAIAEYFGRMLAGDRASASGGARR